MSGSIETPEESHVVGEWRAVEVRVTGYPFTKTDTSLEVHPETVELRYRRGRHNRFDFIEATVHGRRVLESGRLSSTYHSVTWSDGEQMVEISMPDWLYRLARKHSPDRSAE